MKWGRWIRGHRGVWIVDFRRVDSRRRPCTRTSMRRSNNTKYLVLSTVHRACCVEIWWRYSRRILPCREKVMTPHSLLLQSSCSTRGLSQKIRLQCCWKTSACPHKTLPLSFNVTPLFSVLILGAVFEVFEFQDPHHLRSHLRYRRVDVWYR